MLCRRADSKIRDENIRSFKYMCEFCREHHTNYLIPVRNKYADDNICEKLRDDNCEDCCGCNDENFHFTLYHSPLL